MAKLLIINIGVQKLVVAFDKFDMKLLKKLTIFCLLISLALFAVTQGSSFARAEGKEQTVEVVVIVQTDGSICQAKNLELVQKTALLAQDRLGVEVDAIFDTLLHGFSGYVSLDRLDELKNLKGVKMVREVTYYSPSSQKITNNVTREIAPSNVYDTTGLDYHGEGMLVGVIDTGFNASHEVYGEPTNPTIISAGYLDGVDSLSALAKMDGENADKKEIFKQNAFLSKKIVYAFDYASGDFDLAPDAEFALHGDHVASVVAGNSATYKGVAYEAQLALCKVFDEKSNAKNTDVISAMEDMVKIGADVVNVSLGEPCGNSKDDLIDEVLKNAESSGTLFCFSAGNSGYTTSNALLPDNATINSFGSNQYAFSVANFAPYVSGMTPSDSTAYGPAPSLDLKPDIAGIGVGVRGAYGDDYAYLSGSSMASANVAGALTVLKQKLLAQAADLGGAENNLASANLVAKLRSLAMSTATVVTEEIDGEELPYSPRVQGTGMIDLPRALDSDVYLKGTEIDFAKINAGDDKQKSGIITGEFWVINEGASQKEFLLSATAITEVYSVRGGVESMGLRAKKLTPLVKFFDGNQEITSITVPAGESKRLTIKITLGDADKAHLDLFENGMFVEGYVLLDGETDLNIPFLSYYGDWAKDIAQFDEPFSSGIFGGTEVTYTYGNSEQPIPESKKVYTLGEYNGKNSADYAYISCFNGEPIYFSVKTYLLRNVREVEICVTDAIDGREFCKTVYDGGVKYNAKNPERVTFEYELDLTNVAGEGYFANNQRYYLTLKGKGDYGEGQTLFIPFVMDIEAPVVTDFCFGNGHMKFNVSDNGLITRIVISAKYEKDILYEISPTHTPFSYYSVDYIVDYAMPNLLYGWYYINVYDVAGNAWSGYYELASDRIWGWDDYGGRYAHWSKREQRKYDNAYEQDGAVYVDTNVGKTLLYRLADSEYFEIPEGVVRIERGAFAYSHLKRVKFPSTLRYIGDYAFYDTDLEIIDSHTLTAPVWENDDDSYYSPNFPKGVTLNNYGRAMGYDNYVWRNLVTVQEFYRVSLVVDGQSYGMEYLGIGEAYLTTFDGKKGYEFDGWYLDEKCKQKYDGWEIEQDLTLYARWVAKKTPLYPLIIVASVSCAVAFVALLLIFKKRRLK
ncbi:MAG: S8 family serine peptidase [Clostridia bacterium]|nr:S8 family serine peptidase [Clostridia bacterium]